MSLPENKQQEIQYLLSVFRGLIFEEEDVDRNLLLFKLTLLKKTIIFTISSTRILDRHYTHSVITDNYLTIGQIVGRTSASLEMAEYANSMAS